MEYDGIGERGEDFDTVVAEVRSGVAGRSAKRIASNASPNPATSVNMCPASPSSARLAGQDSADDLGHQVDGRQSEDERRGGACCGWPEYRNVRVPYVYPLH